jgi:hypothetical protein
MLLLFLCHMQTVHQKWIDCADCDHVARVLQASKRALDDLTGLFRLFIHQVRWLKISLFNSRQNGLLRALTSQTTIGNFRSIVISEFLVSNWFFSSLFCSHSDNDPLIVQLDG